MLGQAYNILEVRLLRCSCRELADIRGVDTRGVDTRGVDARAADIKGANVRFS